METPAPNEAVTRSLEDLVGGRSDGVNTLLPLVYERLREMARRQLEREGSDHTLQPTALIHEAYLKLVDQKRARWESEAHFLAVAATAMRRVLIDHARGRGRDKRGGGRRRVAITDAEVATPVGEVDLLVLDDTLRRLEGTDAVAARIVEMRFFGGMEMEWIARVLGVTDRTARRHWVYAKAWIAREILGDGEMETAP